MTMPVPKPQSSRPIPILLRALGIGVGRGRNRKSSVEILPSDSRDERIEKGKLVVDKIAAEIARTYRRESGLQLEDLAAAGYVAMIRTIDLPPRELPYENRIEVNARRAMCRDLARREAREYRERQRLTQESHAETPPQTARGDQASKVDQDRHSTRRGEWWQGAFVRKGWARVNGRRVERFASRAEFANRDWQMCRSRRWAEIRESHFDRDLCEYVKGPARSSEVIEDQILKRDQLFAQEHLRKFGGTSFQRAAVFGWSATATDRRMRGTFFTDMFTKHGKPRPIPAEYRLFHERPLIECLSTEFVEDRNALRTCSRWGPGYAIKDVRLRGFQIPLKH